MKITTEDLVVEANAAGVLAEAHADEGDKDADFLWLHAGIVQVGAAIVERLDEHNRQAKRIADSLREAESRSAVLDEVLDALEPVLSPGYFANAQGAIERLRQGDKDAAATDDIQDGES